MVFLFSRLNRLERIAVDQSLFIKIMLLSINLSIINKDNLLNLNINLCIKLHLTKICKNVFSIHVNPKYIPHTIPVHTTIV